MSGIVVITNGNYFALEVLRPLLEKEKGKGHDLRVVLARASIDMGSRGSWRSLIRSWGPRYTLYKLATQYGIPVLGAASRRPLTVAQMARRAGVERVTIDDANSRAFRAQVAAWKPELLISVSCPYRLGSDVLGVPSVGCINVHTSLLPAYAGVSTYVHMLAEQPDEVGVTVHEMVERLDAGAVLRRDRTVIEPGESVFTFFRRLCVMAGRILDEAVSEAKLEGKIVGEQQDLALRSYRKEPTTETVRSARRNGHPLVRMQELAEAFRS